MNVLHCVHSLFLALVNKNIGSLQDKKKNQHFLLNLNVFLEEPEGMQMSEIFLLFLQISSCWPSSASVMTLTLTGRNETMLHSEFRIMSILHCLHRRPLAAPPVSVLTCCDHGRWKLYI